MRNIINKFLNYIDKNEIKILCIILIIILLSQIVLFIIKLFYLKNIKNKNFQIDEISLKENDEIKELHSLIKFSYNISKIFCVLLAISILFLMLDILYFINMKERIYYERFELIVSGYVYYYIVTLIALISFFTLIIISIYLYYRYNKKYFKKYLKFDILLLILNILLYISGKILNYIR